MDTKSIVKWDPFSIGYFKNPYAHLEQCRKTNPVQKIYEDSYFFFKHKDINAILKETDFKVHSLSEYLGEKEPYIFKNVENACPYLSKATQLWPMYLNNDIHRKIRTAITKAFHAIPLDEIIVESIEKTLMHYKNQFSFNLVDFCGTFIYYFIKKVLNINQEEYTKVKHFSNLLARSQDLYIPKQIYQQINAEIVLLRDIFKDSEFKNTVIEETKDLDLDEDQLYSIMLISFMAAFETSKDNLSLGLYEILKNPQLIEYVTNTDKNGLKILLEEILRYSSPLQFTIRINTHPIHTDEYLIPENSKLYLCIASANRDETVFEQPDTLIPNRTHNPHLAFGLGKHQCLGASIGRKELELCLQPMINFLKDYTIEDIKWSKQIFMRTANTILLQKRN